MTMSFFTLTNDFDSYCIESGIQCASAVAFMIVNRRPASPRLHRQSRLRSIQRLDRYFFINTKDNCIFRGREVQPDTCSALSFLDVQPACLQNDALSLNSAPVNALYCHLFLNKIPILVSLTKTSASSVILSYTAIFLTMRIRA